MTLPLNAELNEKDAEGLCKAPPINSLCINPGYATRGISGGTFSEILLLPRDTKNGYNPLHSRTNVKVIRI